MKFTTLATIVALFAFVSYRLLSNPTIATLVYILLSGVLNFDSDHVIPANYDGETEKGGFTHRFVHINQTFKGHPVKATYHVVECGDASAEPIVFGHGLGENWRVWKHIMQPLCASYRAIAYDSEGMGQSNWPDPISEIPVGESRDFMADMTMEMLRKIGVHCFNLVITDYSFWTTLSMLTEYGDNTIIRYGKFQSTVGVEDMARIPQAQLMRLFPKQMNWLINLNPYAMARILFGNTLIKGWTALDDNKRNAVTIDEQEFREVVMSGSTPGSYTAWVYFYHRGKDMLAQMRHQINAFHNAAFPVYIMQGKVDKGQPIALFDGTASIEVVERPAVTFAEKTKRMNHTHVIATTYSKDDEPIGPTAPEFFPNSKWVKYTALDGVGHFLHMEAPDVVIEALKELLGVPTNAAFNPDKNDWCPVTLRNK